MPPKFAACRWGNLTLALETSQMEHTMPKCPAHGTFNAKPNRTGDTFCPKCWDEGIKKGLGVDHLDKPSDYATSSISMGVLSPWRVESSQCPSFTWRSP